MTVDEINSLSEKAKENLRKNAESRESNSKFIKLQPNEKRILKFMQRKLNKKKPTLTAGGARP